MTGLKLAKLPDRTPVRIAITVSPDLNQSLHAYAELYREAYGASESVPELIPYMLEAFLRSDHGFVKARKEGTLAAAPTATAPAHRGRPRRGATSSPSESGGGA
ncbi:MAG TPA: DUF2274 domain-containing protein [Stellaceae bacterium]|nr:DUF2274 domain-containing protein [Stellaceae bacterium]